MLSPGEFDVPILAVTGTYDYGQAVLRAVVAGRRPSSGISIERVAHNALNSVWDDFILANPTLGVQDNLGDALHGSVVRNVVRDAVTSMLLGLTDTRWWSWFRGAGQPASFSGVELHLQYRPIVSPALVVDNFGDDDPELFPGGTPGGPWPPDIPDPLAPTFFARNTLGLATALNATSDSDGLSIDYAVEPPGRPGVAGSVGGVLPVRTSASEYSSDVGPPGAGAFAFLGGSHVLGARLAVHEVQESLAPFHATPADHLIGVTDSSGESSWVRAGAVVAVASERPVEERVLLPDGVSTVPIQLAVGDARPVRTQHVPLDAFVSANPDIDLTRLVRVSWRDWSRPDLKLWLDDVELWL